MKQIFDWLREQISDTAYCEDDGTCGYCQRTWCPHCLVDRDDLDKIINEAEAKCSDIEQDAYERGYVLGFDNGYKDGQYFEKAKWESGCCEWEWFEVDGVRTYANCKYSRDTLDLREMSDFQFCPYCGRKISEVE